jgi:hypothetical protein
MGSPRIRSSRSPRRPKARHHPISVTPSVSGARGSGRSVPRQPLRLTRAHHHACLEWTPRQIVDDGRKTSVGFPVNLAVMPAPMVCSVGPHGGELVDTRQVESVMVLDYFFKVAELPIGTGKTAETARMVRQPPRTMACPGDPACPVWPQARARGAGPSNVDPSPAYGAGHFRDPLRRGLAAIT